MKNYNAFRYPLMGTGILLLSIALGFAFEIEAVVGFWPWQDTPLSHLFIGSILAAASVAMIWIGWRSEWGALPAGALNILVIGLGFAIYFLMLYSQKGQTLLLTYAIINAVAALAGVAAFLWARQIPLRDLRPMPSFTRVAFGIFVIALLLASFALILKYPTIFPWPLNPDSSVLFGLIFLGDAFYFLYGVFNPRWHNAHGQLLSFLMYDLVLIVPFLNHFAAVKPEHLVSLVAYIAVLVFSGGIAVYYLFINQATKNWGVVSGENPK